MSQVSSRISEQQLVLDNNYPAVSQDYKPRTSLFRFMKRIVLIGIIAVAFLNIGQYAHSKRYVWFPKRWGTVVPDQVFRSGQLSESIVGKTLATYNIQTILDLNGKDIYDPEQCEELVAAEKLGVNVFRYQLCGDGTGDLERYASAVALIDQSVKENQRILVHCSAGTKRTGGVIAFYRLLVLKQDPEFVLNELVRYGMKKDSNRPLFVYLRTNMKQMAEKLVEKGIIPVVPETIPQLPI